MLLKLGVYIDRISRPIRRALNVIDDVFERYGEEAIITSTDEGNHSPSSLHYDRVTHGAVDIRKPKKSDNRILTALRQDLGRRYDVIEEKTHYHVEYEGDRRK